MEFNYLGVNITSSGNLVKEIKTQAQKSARVSSWGNKLKNIQGNRTPDYDICPRNKGRNIKNQTNVGSKWDESTKKNS